MSRLIRFSYLILFFLTPLIFTSFNSELFELPKMYFVYTLTIFILTFHLINTLQGNAPIFRKTFLDIPLILFLISQIISTVLSADIHTSIYGYYSRLNGGLLSIVCYLLLYWILSIYIDDKLKQNLIYTSLASGFLVAGFGILEHFGIDKHMWVQDVQARVFSTLGQPNWLAAYLCILLPLTVSRSLNFLKDKKYFLFTISYLLLAIYYLCLLFTKSKSGIIAAIVSLSIYFIFHFLKDKSFSFLLLAISCLLLTIFINNPIKDKLFPQKLEIENSKIENLNITPSEDIRKIVWQGAFDLWKKFPLFGTGVESFAYSYYWTRPVAHNLTSEWDFLYNKAHNEYLNYLACTGTFGFISYLLIIIFIIKNLIENCKLKIENLAILSSIASILITNTVGFSVVIVSLYFFLLPTLTLSPPSEPSPLKSSSLVNQFFIFIVIIFFVLAVHKTISFYLADIAYSQAENYDSSQKYEIAYDFIKSASTYHPGEPVYLNKLASIAAKLAITTKDPKYINEAVDSSNLSSSISPANVNFWKETAQMYYYLATLDPKYFADSIASLQKAALLAPTDAKTFYLLGKFYESGNLKAEAQKYYQQAVDLKPNYDHAYFALGVIYFDQKKYDLAKKNFESALQIAPNNLDAKNYLEKIIKILNT